MTHFYAPLLQNALHAAFPGPLLAQMASAGHRVVAKDAAGDTAAERAAISAAARAVGGAGDTAELERVLAKLITDSYTAGLHTAAEQSGGYVTSAAGQVAAGIDWGTWEPGDPDAAIMTSDGGLADLLEQAGVTINGVQGSTLDLLGNAIADGVLAGDNLDTIAGSLGGLVGDRADIIAHTETARAVDAATLDTYDANGIEQFEIILADGACEECEAEADANPHPVSDGSIVPVHPWCRCASAPIVIDRSTGEETDGEPTDDAGGEE